MAEKAKHKKKKPHKIITTRAEDGSFGHEHVDEDGRQKFAGTSQTMEDLHQHMDDHLGGDEEQPEGEEPAAQAGAAPAPQQGEEPGE